MKGKNSLPIPDDVQNTVNWELNGKIYSVKVEKRNEEQLRLATKLIQEQFAKWEQINNTAKREYSDFENMMLVAIDALVDVLKMKEEYDTLVDVVASNQALIQNQLLSDSSK